MLRLSLICFALMTATSFAQVVTLRSGQHADFTRLVITMSEAKSWDFGRTASGYAFRVRSDNAQYDLSTVFQKIPRNRLSGAWLDEASGTLHLEIACKCHAVASPFRRGIVVIDLIEGEAPPKSPFEAALTDPGQILPSLVQAQDIARPTRRPRNFIEPKPLNIPTLLPVAPPIAPVVLPRQIVERDAEIPVLQAQLLREFSSGVAAGVVSAERPIPRRSTAIAPSAIGSPRIVPIKSKNDSQHITFMPEQVRVRDRDGDLWPIAAPAGVVCIAPDLLNIMSWGDLDNPLSQLASVRTSIMGEFDRFDPQKIDELVKLYIFYGFGAEAGELLGQMAPGHPQIRIYQALADIIEGTESGGVFTGMSNCDGSAALWSILENPNDAVDALSIPDVVAAFSDLPLWLRRALGARLADSFLAVGEYEAARAISASISRATGSTDNSVALIDAKLELASSPMVGADHALDEIVESASPHAGTALTLLLESKIKRGDQIDISQILALEAFAQEVKHSPLGPQFRRTVARSLTAVDEGVRAFSEYALHSPQLYPELWDIMAEVGSDLTVATLALAPPTGSMKDVPAETRRAIAKRLLHAGFADGGLKWVEGSLGQEEDFFRAQVDLKARDGRSALRRVAGQRDSKADLIRAESYELLGDFVAAHDAWKAAGNADRSQMALFRGRDWQSLRSSEGNNRIGLVDQLTPTGRATDLGELAQARRYLGASIDSRDQIANALASVLPE